MLQTGLFLPVETKQIPTLSPNVYIKTTVYTRLTIIFSDFCFNISTLKGIKEKNKMITKSKQ